VGPHLLNFGDISEMARSTSPHRATTQRPAPIRSPRTTPRSRRPSQRRLRGGFPAAPIPLVADLRWCVHMPNAAPSAPPPTGPSKPCVFCSEDVPSRHSDRTPVYGDRDDVVCCGTTWPFQRQPPPLLQPDPCENAP
jgi:hypothetical protein